MYDIYPILYSFHNKRTFLNFWRNGPKNIENVKISFFFVKYVCMWTDCQAWDEYFQKYSNTNTFHFHEYEYEYEYMSFKSIRKV